MTTTTSTMTLSEALEHTYRTRWAHARDGGKCLYSQARSALSDLNMTRGTPYRETVIRDVTEADVHTATAYWYAKGLSPATITKRLNCLSAMGVKVSGTRPPKERKLKWWLRPEEEARAIEALGQPLGPLTFGARKSLQAYIQWTTRTGLRVEETLRLTAKDFNADLTEVTVPGTKTADSQATLPLGQGASDAAEIMLTGLQFADYQTLEAAWRHLRTAMGWSQAATLKALRRSAARYLHVECSMPLHMVQQYLRHENINTTLDYLRLTGGYGTEEMRRYLK